MKKLLLSALLLLSTPVLAQVGDLSKVEVKSIPVAGNVHMLEGAGGNIGVSVGPDGVLLVDDQFAPLVPKIRAELDKLVKAKAKGKAPATPEYVLNTHWHIDHTGGNAAFGRESRIVAHQNVRKRLAAGQERQGRKIPPAPEVALPVITYTLGLSLHFNGEEIQVTHLPAGHTDGDSMVYFTGSNVLHLGDHFFVDRFPFIDLSSGGTVRGYLRNVQRVLHTMPPGVKIIPGHGPLADRAALERYHQMLLDSVQHVQSQLAAGKTLAQVKAAGMPEKYKSWGEGFISTDQWLETVYLSLGGKDPGKAATE